MNSKNKNTFVPNPLPPVSVSYTQIKKILCFLWKLSNDIIIFKGGKR